MDQGLGIRVHGLGLGFAADRQGLGVLGLQLRVLVCVFLKPLSPEPAKLERKPLNA